MRIGDYALLSDCRTAALVSGGSVDWYCPPRFDSPSVFARILDPGAGSWELSPAEPSRSERAYVADSLVLRTVFATSGGRVEQLDLLAFGAGSRGHEVGLDVPHTLVRVVRGLSGTVPMTLRFEPRFEYGLTAPRLEPTPGGLLAEAGPTRLSLRSPVPLETDAERAAATFDVRAGDSVGFTLSYAPTFSASTPPPLDAEGMLAETLEGWRTWMEPHDRYQGRYRDEVRRAAVVLQGLTYQPSGAIVAAATTSLPERLGGEWDWDYRYAWLRDLSFMMRALWVAACPDEPTAFLRWIDRAGGLPREKAVQIMYGVEGERDLTEHVLDHLEGHRGSRPVRVGNDAWRQRQTDVLGEVLDAAHLLRDYLGDPVDERLRDMLVSFADRSVDAWRGPDAGMWEARDRDRHYLSSKVMCWVGLDRALALADLLRVDERRRRRWRESRDAAREAILGRGWDADVGAFTGAWGSRELDASVLLMPLVGFIDARDPRMRATIETIDRELATGGLVRRWREEPNAFVMCSYWLVECLELLGRTEEAHARFERLGRLANDVGIMAEEADPDTGEPLGNMPQAFSHVGLVNAAWRFETTEGTASGGDRAAEGGREHAEQYATTKG